MNLTVSQVEQIIRATADSTKDNNSHDTVKLTCSRVLKVFDPDPDGLVEVIYLNRVNEPLTAYLRGKTVISVADGW